MGFLSTVASAPCDNVGEGGDSSDGWCGSIGVGGCTTTCELILTEDSGSCSSSDPCGEMKRAVGRGPVEEGPLFFFNIGCGMEACDFEFEEDEAMVLGRLRSGLWRDVLLADTAGP